MPGVETGMGGRSLRIGGGWLFNPSPPLGHFRWDPHWPGPAQLLGAEAKASLLPAWVSGGGAWGREVPALAGNPTPNLPGCKAGRGDPQPPPAPAQLRPTRPCMAPWVPSSPSIPRCPGCSAPILHCWRRLLGVDKVLSYALTEWLSDIRKNQLPGILGGVGPMHSVVQLGETPITYPPWGLLLCLGALGTWGGGGMVLGEWPGF